LLRKTPAPVVASTPQAAASAEQKGFCKLRQSVFGWGSLLTLRLDETELILIWQTIWSWRRRLGTPGPTGGGGPLRRTRK